MRAILMLRNCEGQSHKTVSTDPVEKGEPKRIRTEVFDLLLASLTPYRNTKPAQSRSGLAVRR